MGCFSEWSCVWVKLKLISFMTIGIYVFRLSVWNHVMFCENCAVLHLLPAINMLWPVDVWICKGFSAYGNYFRGSSCKRGLQTLGDNMLTGWSQAWTSCQVWQMTKMSNFQLNNLLNYQFNQIGFKCNFRAVNCAMFLTKICSSVLSAKIDGIADADQRRIWRRGLLITPQAGRRTKIIGLIMVS